MILNGPFCGRGHKPSDNMSDLLMWVGKENSADLSAMAHEIMFEFYSFVPKEGVQRFFDEFQTPEAIEVQMDEGYRYAFIMKDGERIGYTAYVIKGDEMIFSKYYIYNQFRGSGFGTKTLDHILSIAKGSSVKRVILHVNEYNLGAIRLYERKGFRKVCEEDGYNTKTLRMDLDL